MTSEPLRPGDTLRTHVDRQLMNAARTLHDFVLHETQPTTLGGLPALHARFHWRAHFGELEQTVTSVRREIDGRPMVTSITTTVLIGEADATRDAFTAMLASLRFADGPDAPGAPSDPNATDPSNPFVPIPGHKRDNRDKGRS